MGRPVERVPVGAHDLDLDDLADERHGAGRLDVDDSRLRSVRPCTRSRAEVALLALARALDEHLLPRAHERRQVRRALRLDQLEQAGQPLALRLLGHVVAQAQRGRVAGAAST